jgi:mono/diheme cytochrome c family protein
VEDTQHLLHYMQHAKLSFFLSPMRRTGLLSWLVVLSLFIAVLAGTGHLEGATTSASDVSASGSLKHGDQIFHQRCVACHNKQPGDSSPFGPPNLFDLLRHSSSLSPKQAETIIEQGKGNMPAFGSVLSKSDIRSIIAYLRAKPN